MSCNPGGDEPASWEGLSNPRFLVSFSTRQLQTAGFFQGFLVDGHWIGDSQVLNRHQFATSDCILGTWGVDPRHISGQISSRPSHDFTSPQKVAFSFREIFEKNSGKSSLVQAMIS